VQLVADAKLLYDVDCILTGHRLLMIKDKLLVEAERRKKQQHLDDFRRQRD